MLGLEEWVKRELTIDLESELSKHKEKVKSLVKLSPSGEVIVKNAGLSAKQKVLAYLIGKAYSNFAKYSSDIAVTNRELVNALRLPEGTVKYNLHELRNEGLITAKEEGVHQIKIAEIGRVFEKYFRGVIGS